MIKIALGMVVFLTQLSAPASGPVLPQIMTASFKPAAAVKAGAKTDVNVSFNLLNGYAINRTPPITLKFTEVPGIKLEKTDFTSSSDDPKSKDEYYVDLPALKVPVTAARPGTYEIPGKLTYFFCSKSDGFCSRQVFDVKMAIAVQ
jgi:hypothetical protein